MSSSQLTNSMICQRGCFTTNQDDWLVVKKHVHLPPVSMSCSSTVVQSSLEGPIHKSYCMRHSENPGDQQ